MHNSIGSSLCSEQELQIIAEVICNRKKTFLIYVTNFFTKNAPFIVVKWPEPHLDITDTRYLPGCCMWWIFTQCLLPPRTEYWRSCMFSSPLSCQYERQTHLFFFFFWFSQFSLCCFVWNWSGNWSSFQVESS